MRIFDVRTPEDALVYITDCNLATVSDMAGKKKRPIHEFNRQVSIAQLGVEWIRDFGINPGFTRAGEILESKISVSDWAKKFYQENQK